MGYNFDKEQLRKALMLDHYSIQEASEFLGISKGYLKKLLSGERASLSDELLEKLRYRYGVYPESLGVELNRPVRRGRPPKHHAPPE